MPFFRHFIAGPTAFFVLTTTVSAQVPPPSPTTLGGVYSFSGVASHWLWQLNTDGTWTTKQPAITDLVSPKTDVASSIASNPTYNTAVNQFGGGLLIARPATQNSIVGAAVQDGSNGSSFPTGVTGYGYLNDPGNSVFGMFSQCDQHTAGTCVGAEFDTFNYAGSPNGTFPPVTSFGTTSYEPITQQVVAFGTYASKIGTYYNSGAGPGGYIAAIYMNPLAALSYGILVDATGTYGATVAGTFHTTGGANTSNIYMQMKGAANASARFINAVDSLGGGTFYVDGSGNVNTQGVYKVNNAQIAAVNLADGTVGTGKISLSAAPVASTLCGSLTAANMNTTSDQVISITPPSATYVLQNVRFWNPSTSLTTAAGGIYTAASKGGTQVVSASTTYAALSTNAPNTAGNILAGSFNNYAWNVTTMYLSLTTPQGAAATANVSLYCAPLQ